VELVCPLGYFTKSLYKFATCKFHIAEATSNENFSAPCQWQF
jgi:hypothetical protein